MFVFKTKPITSASPSSLGVVLIEPDSPLEKQATKELLELSKKIFR